MKPAESTARFLGAHDRNWLSRIEDAGLNASAPPQQRWMDGWLVRLCPGKAQRARCINALAAGRQPLLRTLEECRALFEAAGLPLMVRITPFTQPPELDALLAGAGFEFHDETRVMVRPQLRDPALDLSAAGDDQPPAGTIVAEVDGTTYADVVGALRGSAPAERGAQAQRLALSPVPYRGFVLRRSSDHREVLACAQFAREGPLVGLYDVMVAASARRQGLASWLCEHLLSLAALDGAQTAYLQVGADNLAARRIYSRMGFSDAYSYHYRRLPTPRT
jgi:ribosomal protein S18 acetylase RimI-like enzyme